jgi:hypothetical protein
MECTQLLQSSAIVLYVVFEETQRRGENASLSNTIYPYASLKSQSWLAKNVGAAGSHASREHNPEQRRSSTDL